MNLSGLAPITTAATALSNLILVTPNQVIGYQPQNTANPTGPQPPSILFHYEGEQTVSIESDITDHYIEDNTAIQDQIALKPETVTTHGFIGELNNVPPKALALLNKIANKLTIVGAYVPVLSETALLAYNNAFLLYQVGQNAANTAISAWSSITGDSGTNVIDSNGLQGNAFNAASGSIRGNQSKQQIAFQQFYGYWRSRTLFTVQTPWAVFQNMAIKSLRAIQDADSRVITDFEVTFKMIRTASTTNTIALRAVLDGRAALQAAGLTDFGTTTPVPSIGMGEGLTQMGVA